jgi:prepilin-type N-terminal cleavage/methylation domain-containing protein
MLQAIRQLKKESRGAKHAGFTIIEVMIVLAIAGLIMGIVFLAIPALQRTNRNTQRKNDASRLAGLVAEYGSNNNGSLPANVAAAINTPTWSYFTTVSLATFASTPGAPDSDTMKLITGAKCNGTGIQAGTARQYAVYYGIEPSGTACLEN